MSSITCLGAPERANYGDAAACSQLGERGAEINPVSRMYSACQLICGELAASGQLSQQLLLKRIHIQPLGRRCLLSPFPSYQRSKNTGARAASAAMAYNPRTGATAAGR